MNICNGFFNYLSKEIKEGKIDFRIRAIDVGDGVIEFYIHPQNISGDTMDFSLIRYENGETILIKKPTATPC